MFPLRKLLKPVLRHRIKTIACLIGSALLFLYRTSVKIGFRDFFYLTRPIWDEDKELKGSIRLPHFYSPNLVTEQLCELHGWTVRSEYDRIPKVIDAFIFSNELDLLEIRMKELWDVVDLFVLVEANVSFTGKEKPLFFNENKERFAWAEEKLRHFTAKGLSSNPRSPFSNEALSRRNVKSSIESLNPQKGDLVIVGDIDEIPYQHTIRLLKQCKGWPDGLHLELQNYRYSFEFRLFTTNWRPHVAVYNPSSFSYHHQKGNKNEFGGVTLLADAGWHCSFCFPKIEDLIFKMTSYSHNERVMKEELLQPENIQRRLCDGEDIFGMLPEVYSFRDLVVQWRPPAKSGTTLGIPEYVVLNADKFKYLLPGGCLRDS